MSISVMFYFPAYTKPYRLFFITFVSFRELIFSSWIFILNVKKQDRVGRKGKECHVAALVLQAARLCLFCLE